MNERADILMVKLGLVESRARAQAEIAAQNVTVDGQLVKKPSQKIQDQSGLKFRAPPFKWVSRAAAKLEHGLDHFDFDVSGKHVLDLGASTGGFSQVALARGAAHVYAVDVGHGQLHEDLKTHVRLTSFEGMNVRDISQQDFDNQIEFIVCDLSFISLKLGLPAAMAISAPGARLVALVKPQFEVGKGNLGRGGIVKDTGLRKQVVDDIKTWMSGNQDWSVVGSVESPITGADGNKEYLIAAQKITQ